MGYSITSTKKHTRDILRILDQVERDLKAARNWGIYDILGGKTIVGLIKHNKIKKAENRLKSVKRELKSLQNELMALDIPVNTRINAGSFNKFMDIFVDNTIANWYTQAKIGDGLREVRYLQGLIEGVYRDLDRL